MRTTRSNRRSECDWNSWKHFKHCPVERQLVKWATFACLYALVLRSIWLILNQKHCWFAFLSVHWYRVISCCSIGWLIDHAELAVFSPARKSRIETCVRTEQFALNTRMIGSDLDLLTVEIVIILTVLTLLPVANAIVGKWGDKKVTRKSSK